MDYSKTIRNILEAVYLSPNYTEFVYKNELNHDDVKSVIKYLDENQLFINDEPQEEQEEQVEDVEVEEVN